MYGFMMRRPQSGDRPAPFHSKLSIKAEGAVVLLGAGASAPVGAPLMRGFIDRGRDYQKLGLFAPGVVDDVKATIDLYDSLRSTFQITEEDIENIENLLSLAALVDDVPSLDICPPLKTGVADSIRRFIDAVLVKAIRLPEPHSPEWLLLDLGPPHKRIVAALAFYEDRCTIITLNYDCVLEYSCHCMGLPFTYDRGSGKGAEILKLHGTINWLFCPNSECSKANHVEVAELVYTPGPDENDGGFVEPKIGKCGECGATFRPLIVPPIWGKPIEHQVLRRVWSRAFEALSKAEVLVSIGYSLPEADPKVRELLHVGLASAALRQAMVVVGNDEGAAKRWNSLFRESWRQYRLDVRSQSFETMAKPYLFEALAIPKNAFYPDQLNLLPLQESPALNQTARERLEASLKAHKVWNDTHGIAGVDWVGVVGMERRGDKKASEHIKVLSDAGLIWHPEGPILPSHGTQLNPY